jgi:hypothetical protein
VESFQECKARTESFVTNLRKDLNIRNLDGVKCFQRPEYLGFVVVPDTHGPGEGCPSGPHIHSPGDPRVGSVHMEKLLARED